MPMLPFYIYYSMFGFQRVGDLIWAAADQRARGFLLGATAGRTTLGGEGLQHQDGTQPAGRSDRAELPRLRPGVRRRGGGDPRPRHATHAARAGGRVLLPDADERELRAALAAGWGRGGRAQGAVPHRHAACDVRREVRLLGSGTILREVLAAAELLRSDWRRRCRGLERHQLQRTAARRDRGRTLQPRCTRSNRDASATSRAACRATCRWSPRATTCAPGPR